MNIQKVRTAEMSSTMTGQIITDFDTQVTDPDVNVASFGLSKQLNDKLTASSYSTSLSNLSQIIDEYIANNSFTRGETKKFTFSVTGLGNNIAEITRTDQTIARYTGIIINTSGSRYTLYKDGSASSVITSF